MIFYVHVGVALERPPKIHELRRYAVEARSGIEAKEIALCMACCTSVMPVWAKIVGDEEFPDPDHHAGWDLPVEGYGRPTPSVDRHEDAADGGHDVLVQLADHRRVDHV